MRHSVILGSYERPRMVARAIRSVLRQTITDLQLVVVDDGSSAATLDVICNELGTDERCLLVERGDRPQSWLDRINDGVSLVDGDLVHYLADDDYYDLSRFEAFEELFGRQDVIVGFGRLYYVTARCEPRTPATRFVNKPVADPHCVLDYNQVAHLRSCFEKLPQWIGIDAVQFRGLANIFGPFQPIDRPVAYKTIHPFNLLSTVQATLPREPEEVRFPPWLS